MKKIIIIVVAIILCLLSLIIGSIKWLYDFKKSSFAKGATYLDDKMRWVDKLEKAYDK